MGKKKSGDKSKYYRERRKKYAKRVRMRALRQKAAAGSEERKEAPGSP
jgi:hypothetical protein